ncbi:MAG TPA: phosphotransferase [Clostridia bacterium]
MADILINLHSQNPQGCPVPDHTSEYLETAEKNYKSGKFNKENIFGLEFGYPADAWRFAEERKRLLKSDTLIHGDYCLPNVILNDWRFSGFIDVGNGGVGDKHVDIFWATWSLWFNLKTNKYTNYFIDAYGRDKIDNEVLRFVSVVEMFG